MPRSHGTTNQRERIRPLTTRIGGIRTEAVTESAIVLAVVVLGIAAVLVLMRGATSGDLAVLFGTRAP